MTDTSTVEQALIDRAKTCLRGAPNNGTVSLEWDTLDRLLALIDRLAKPVASPDADTIDLERVFWATLAEAAAQSNWIPPEYFANDWVNDCADFLRNGPAISSPRPVDEVREALRPFAECCAQISETESDEEWAKFRLLVSDYRRARQAYERKPIP